MSKLFRFFGLAICIYLMSHVFMARAQLPMLGAGLGGKASGGVCSEATTFLGRTSGLDGTHTTAYTNLICGLVSDGVWSSLDVLYIFATQDSATSLLSLVSATFNATAINPTKSLIFTADRGYTTGNAADYIDTNFNSTTASSPKYVRDSASFGFWGYDNNAATLGSPMGTGATGAAGESNIFPRYTADVFYPCVNSPSCTSVANASTQGLFSADRTSSTVIQGYRNGSQVGSNITNSSDAPLNAKFTILSVSSSLYAYQVSAAHIGSSLGLTKEGQLYTRMRTYMTAVGVP